MDVDALYRPALARAWLWIGASVLAVAAFVIVPALHFALPTGINAALHTLLETVSIVVSALVFSCGALRITGRTDDSIGVVSAGFLAVAVLDFVHVLCFEGMPELFTPSGAGKAIVFFLAARLIVAAAMLVVALVVWERPDGRQRHVFGAVSLSFAALVAIGGFDPAVKRLFFVPGEGLTALKIALEWVVIAMYLAAAMVLRLRMRSPQPYPVVAFFTAAVLMGMSEYCFTLYATPRDQYSNLGHLLKVVAYFFVYEAVLHQVVRRPYLQLQEAREALNAANARLEQRVLERTQQLEAANRDLETFSYSVAHDLRAPLKAINGFSGALEQQLSAQLAPAQTHFLERIRANSQRMSEMIDALLELSKLSRASAARQPLDVAVIADEVIENLRRAEPGREVQVWVRHPLPATGDPALLRTALQNLIGNAWKFTGRRESARIEVGMYTADTGEPVYYVRDNGEGFDMAYAPRLFGMFQRLHTDPAFGGHGIGLVNVRRIIALHGGRIWAEAQPDQGATFYFTLGEVESAPAAAEAAGAQAASL